MFTKTAHFYDTIYSFKDYEAESDKLHEIIKAHVKTDGDMLLDIACGTAKHAHFLQAHYTITGLDLDAGMIKIAAERLPDAQFYVGDMRDFSLGQSFDAVVSLFSSVGYLTDLDALDQAVANMARHTKQGGVLIIEPWLKPDVFVDGRISAMTIESDDLYIVRMTRGELTDDRGSILHFHYLIGSKDGIEHFTERHEMRLHSHDEYMQAFEKAGLQVQYDAEGLNGRGLYIGLRPL